MGIDTSQVLTLILPFALIVEVSSAPRHSFGMDSCCKSNLGNVDRSAPSVGLSLLIGK